jgi:hypothetical protein
LKRSRPNWAATIDPRQVQDLPTAGRNWMSLALLAPGNRTNAQGALPVQDRVDVREFQLNVDGLQVTANLGTGNQSRYSNDAIARVPVHLQPLRRDAGPFLGRAGERDHQVGDQRPRGHLRRQLPRQPVECRRPVLNTKVPYKNQQYSGTIGGPIVLNKLHYFANYEYEHQPLTSIWNTAFAPFNVTLNGTHHVNLSGIRLDGELSSKTRLMGKVNHSSLLDPFGTGSANHPSGTAKNEEHSTDALGELTQVLSNKALNSVRVGYASYGINQSSLTTWSQHWQAANGITNGGPNLTFRGFRTGRNGNIPRYRNQNTYTIHDDFTYSYDARGHHDLKAGGEYSTCSTTPATATSAVARRRSTAARFRPTSPRSCPTRSTPTRGSSRARPWCDCDALFRRRVRCIELPDASAHVEVRRVGAGRLESDQQADAEPRRPLRPDLERVRAERDVPAVRVGGPSAGREQPPAASRLRLHAHRQDGAARWRGSLLQRRAEHERAVADEPADHRGCRR